MTNATQTNSISKGDLDNDGDEDVSITSRVDGSDNLFLFRNSNSTLIPSHQMRAKCFGAFFFWPNGSAIGDLNNDGRADVVVSGGGNRPHSCIEVFYGTSTGTYSPGVVIASHDIPGAIRVTDVDLDGLDDVLVTHVGWQTLGLYLQKPDGTLHPERLHGIPGGDDLSSGIAVGDFTNDGCTDIAIAGPSSLITLRGDLCGVVYRNGFE
jgi:hypothetical protein